jgi:cystathionine gamma-synthase
MSSPYRTETNLNQSGVCVDGNYKPIAPALHLSATFGWDDTDHKPAFDYSRSGNPTRSSLQNALSQLEHANSCSVTASGMAAIHTVLCLLKPEDTIIAPHDCYGGTYRLLHALAAKGQFKLIFVDQTDEQALQNAFSGGAKILFLETPSNPLLQITDIQACVTLAKKHGTLVVADNTFLSPVLQKPLDLGCDVIVHSTTKFLNGHSDVIGGAVLARDANLGEELAWWANASGVNGAAFDAYQTLRGLRTLFVRVERQQKTAGALIDAFHAHPQIDQLFYPGLSSHRGHEIARRQQAGFGSMFSVEFAPSVDVAKLLQRLQLFKTAVSLGGFESLVCLPAKMTHAGMSASARQTAGISDRLVRFSIGMEHQDDLIHDLQTALSKA